MIYSKSIVDEKMPEQEGIVRAELLIDAYYITKNEKGKTIVYYLNQADFKGYIPIWVI